MNRILCVLFIAVCQALFVWQSHLRAGATDDMHIQAKRSGEYTDLTSSIKNPSFENNGLENWINNGMQSQTNNETQAQGWVKDGNVYAEKWVSTGNSLSDASISQVVTGLPPGKYELSVLAHAVNQSGRPAVTTGAYAYAGMDETLFNKGGEYIVDAVVVDGTLEIGIRIKDTDANWVAFDHFRLYYYGEDIEAYNKYLTAKLEIAIAHTLETERPGYYNQTQLKEVIEAAQNVEQTPEALLAVITGLDIAIEEYRSILSVYGFLKDAVEKLEEQLEKSAYPEKTVFQKLIESAREMYHSPEDQREYIQDMLDRISAKILLLSQYNLLERNMYHAKKLYDTSGYEGKTAFGLIIEEIQEILGNPEGKDLYEAITRLEEAMTAYLNTRPSNWMTIRNGALWKDDRGQSVQAHGAGFIQVGDTWYMIGEDRSGPWNPDVNMYSTNDFVNWKFERKIIENGVTHPDLGNSRFVERPKIMYNKKTGKYVVWCHWEQGNYGASEAAVFYCDSVNGPYTFHWAGRPLGIKSRDCTVFVDDDETAYFISTTEENQHLGLFRLSDDYLSVEEHTQLFAGQQREAPAVVRIEDTYFMLFSACSGWDPNQTTYSYSKSLTSDWSSRINIGNSIAYDTQAASILTLQGAENTTYIYVGDRWQDPGLTESKTILFPIHFEGNSVIFNYRQQFDLDLATATYRETDTGNRVPKTDWKIHAFSSEETGSENGRAVNAIDGNPDTKWHTKYSGGAPSAPHYIEVDMGAEYEVSGFLCMPRMDGSNNGTIRSYLFLVSNDAENWEAVSGGAWLPYAAEVYFSPVSARYFRMVAIEGSYACITELDVLMNSTPYTPQAINPYFRIGSSVWRNYTDITVDEGESLAFASNQTAEGGTWAFYGANNHMSPTRDYTISSVSPADAGIYTSVFLNHYGQSSKLDYQVTVMPDDKTDLNEVNTNNINEVERIYYNLQGIKVPVPYSNGIYIMKIRYENEQIKIKKIMINSF